MCRKLFVIVLLLCFNFSFSQYTQEDSEENKKEEEKENRKDKEVLENERPAWVDNITVGGDFGLFFRTNSGYFGIAPKFGYRVKPWFNPGITLRYSFSYARLNNGTFFRNHTYGTGAFLHFRFFDKLFVGVEYEILNVLKWNSLSERTWANVLFLGLGYSQRIGSFGYLNLILQYDVINDENSPFRTSYIIGNPTTGRPIPLRFQIGFSFSLGPN